ncbi:MAG: PKD domain-containing protein [Candidatus Acetothermia bacterium]
MSTKQEHLTLIHWSVLVLISLILFQAWPAFSADEGDVVINEIAWMGTEASSHDEWIEFYNTTGSEVDLEGWSIDGADSGECLDFSAADGSATTKIAPHGYLIYGSHEDDVKNEDEGKVVDIWDATIALNDTEPGKVILYDSSGCEGNKIDVTNQNQSDGDWLAGDSDDNKTMERVSPCESGTDPDNWATNDPEVASNGLDADDNPLNATPKSPNSAFSNTGPTAKMTAPGSVDAGEEFQLDGSDSEDCEGGISSYSWDLNGDGNYDDASGEVATHTVDEAGEVEVGLKVEDDYGETDTATQTVEIEGETNEAPEADPGGGYYCRSGEEITLDGSGSSDPDGTIASYEWDLDGDGKYEDASGAKPSYSCGSEETYDVGLKVTDGGGKTDTATASVEVTDDLRADFSYSPSEPAAGEEVQFSGKTNYSESSVTSWEWNFGDGKSSTEKEPTQVFSETGSHEVTLTVTDDSGEDDSRTKAIEVESPVDVDAGDPRTAVLGEEVKLEGSASTEVSGGEFSMKWEITEKPGGSTIHIGDATDPEPTLVPEASGEYELKLVSTDSNGNRGSDTTTVTVEPDPAVDEENFAVEFVSGKDKSFDKREEVPLTVEIEDPPESAKGSVIAHGLENTPEFDLEGRIPINFHDLKVARIEEGTAEVNYHYEEEDLGVVVEESLKLFYHLPVEGWREPESSSAHPAGDYVSAKIPLAELKGTPLALAGKRGTIEGEDPVVHGPNPVPEDGCIFWLNLPDDIDGANLKIYDSVGKPVLEEKLDPDQERFPETGRWEPVNERGEVLDSGLYLYRLQLVDSDGVSWSDVRKLVIGG